MDIEGYDIAGRRQRPERWTDFGRWLQQQRKRAGLTQKQAAQAAALAHMSWWRLEQGLSGTRIDTIPQIARAIGSDLRQTYLAAGFVPPASLVASADASADPTAATSAGSTLHITSESANARSDTRPEIPMQSEQLPQPVPARSSTLDLLYTQLSFKEQAVLRRLAVFQGDWTRVTAAGVCAGRGLEPHEITPIVIHLVDQHYLYIDERAAPFRYGFLGPLRPYCAARLQAEGEADWMRAQHRGFFARLVEAAGGELEGPDAAEAIGRLEAERKEWEAALDACLQTPGMEEVALRMTVALGRYWERLGQVVAGRAWIAKALALEQAARTSRELRAQALNWAGNLAHAEGDFPESRRCYEQALMLHEELDRGNTRGIANVKSNLGMVLFDQGEYEAADGYLRQSLELRRRIEDERGVAIALNYMGHIRLRLHDYAQARLCYEECRSLSSKLRIDPLTAHVANSLGLLSFYQGDYEEANAHYAEALELFEDLHDDEGHAKALGNLACLAEREGRREEARRLLSKNLVLCERIDSGEGKANALDQLGCLSLGEGDLREARRRFFESLAMRQAMNDSLGIAVSLEHFSGLAHESRQPARAVQLLAAAAALRSQLGAPAPDVEVFDLAQLRQNLAQALGDRDYEAAWEAGTSLPTADAIALALEETLNAADQRAG